MSHKPILPPQSSEMSDHDVETLGNHLEGKRIALLVTGGIAAMKAPLLARALRRQKADVVCYVSKEALRYTTMDALEWSSLNPVVDRLSANSEHLSMDKPIDLYLIAPATYNTINKMRHGIADSTITTALATALGLLDRKKAKILIAPTMHGNMHNQILTESMEYLQRLGVGFIQPKDAYGKHNLPDLETIVAETCRLSSDSKLKEKTILVTGGPTPVKIDDVRRITNKFRGKLAIEIAKNLYLSGANVKLILGGQSIESPSYIDTLRIKDYDEYKKSVLSILDSNQVDVGIFSAAVADYCLKEEYTGKLPSGSEALTINLKPTEKVIDLVREGFPELKMISFKFEIGKTKEELFTIGKERIHRGHEAVVLNRQEDMLEDNAHKAYLMPKTGDVIEFDSKKAIAQGLTAYLEQQ